VFAREIVHRIPDIEVKVSSFGIGDNPCFPYDLCVQTFVGNDADIVFWDQSLDGGRGSKQCVESFIRAAVAGNEEDPPIIGILLSNPSAGMSNFRMNQLKGFQIGGGEDNLLKHYANIGVHFFDASRALSKLSPDDPNYSVLRLYGEGKSHGFKRWHPGPYGHLLWGSLLASNYADLISKALEFDDDSENVETDLSIPPPRFDLHPFAAEPRITTCLTSFEPKLRSDLNILDYISNDEIVDLTLMSKWPDISESEIPESADWYMGFSKPNVQKHSREGVKHHGYTDIKWSLIGNPNPNASPIIFELDILKDNSIIMLCRPRDKSGSTADFHSDQVSIKIDDTKVTLNPFNECSWIEGISPGTRKLEILALKKKIALNYILWG
jgi:hypothetical protein